MAKPAAFRFSDDMLRQLKTWAFVLDTDQRKILEEAFAEYTKNRPETQEKVDKILNTIDSD